MSTRVQAVAGIAVAGFAALAGTQFYHKWKFQEMMKEEGHYLKAMQIMNGYEPIREYLGEPVSVRWFNMKDPNNVCDGLKVHFAFPVVGPKHGGMLYYWGSREKYEDEWEINQVDFLKGEGGKRWTFYLRDNQTQNANEE